MLIFFARCSCLSTLKYTLLKDYYYINKVRCLYQCSKMQFITFQNFHIQTWFSQFLWFFSLKCWFKGQMMSKIHLSLPNAYKLMCFDRNVNGNRDVKFLECDKWSLHWYKNLTLVKALLQEETWDIKKIPIKFVLMETH